jgi:hypothetical protein
MWGTRHWCGDRAQKGRHSSHRDDDDGATKTKAAIARGLCGLTDDAELLGCHFFGFAFLPHQFQLALGFLEGGRYFLLHAGSGFFEFLR